MSLIQKHRAVVSIVTASLCMVCTFSFGAPSANAASGACSWHGGVDCMAGADWDGSAICNDGWRDSTESFYSVISCKNTHHSCTLEEFNDISAKYGLDTKKKAVDDATRLLLTPDQATSYAEVRQQTIDTLRKTSQIQTMQAELRNLMSQADSECYALGDKRFYENQLELYRQYLAPTPESDPTKDNAPVCPANATLVGTQCYCNSGYTGTTSGCVMTPAPQSSSLHNGTVTPPNPIELCEQALGPHGIVAGQNTCACVEGYTLSTTKDSCIETPKVVTTPKPPAMLTTPKSTPITSTPTEEMKTGSERKPDNFKVITPQISPATSSQASSNKQPSNTNDPAAKTKKEWKIKSWLKRIFH